MYVLHAVIPGGNTQTTNAQTATGPTMILILCANEKLKTQNIYADKYHRPN